MGIKLRTALLLGLLLASAARGEVRNHPAVTSNLKLLEAWLEAQIAYGRMPGVVVGIVHDQELVYSKGFGFADLGAKRPVDPDTIFRIASHSKLFTAIAVMKLRDEGRLDLDTPIEEYLPWFRLEGSGAVEKPRITLRQLLTHTSGLPKEAGSDYWGDFEFPDLAQIRERLSGQSRVFAPQTRWKYSNLAFTLAGEIVSVVSGVSYDEYVSRNILRPLGMSSTSVVLPDEHRDRLATGYGRRLRRSASRERFPFVGAGAMAPAAGVSSSVADMAKFVSWQFRLLTSEPAEVLSPRTLREMQRVRSVWPSWSQGSGLGFEIVRTGERTLVGHSGLYPGYTTVTYISPEEKVGVIVFSNSLDAQVYAGMPWSISERVFEWVAPAISDAVTGVSVDSPPAEWTAVEGAYRSIWWDRLVVSLDGELRFLNPISPDPKAAMLTLEPTSERDTFRLEGESFDALGEEVVFSRDADQEVVGVKVGEMLLERIDYSAEHAVSRFAETTRMQAIDLEENKEIVRQWIAGLDARDLEVYDRLLAEGAVVHFPNGAEWNREEAIAEEEAFYAAFSDVRHTIEDLIASEDQVVLRHTVRGTHTGEFEGVAPTLREIELTAILIYRISGGQIVEIWAEADLGTLMQSLSAAE